MNKRRRELINVLAAAVTPVLEKRPDAPGKPCAVRALSSDTTEVMIYGDIGSGGWLDEGITSKGMASQLAAISTPNIHVRINSQGGDVFEGTAIHTLLARHAATVTVYIDGIAASAASFIAMAGDKIIMARNAMMMIHDGSTFTFGNEADHLESAELLSKVSDNIADMYAVRASGEADEWRALMRATTWYTGQEAVDAGLADEITGDDPEVDNRVHRALSAHSFRNAPEPPPLHEETVPESGEGEGEPEENEETLPDLDERESLLAEESLHISNDERAEIMMIMATAPLRS